MQSYLEIERTETHVVYRYQTFLSYFLYGALLSGVMLFVTDASRMAEHVLAALMVIYVVAVYIPSRARLKTIKNAMRGGGVQMKGSRWSFSRPLMVRVPLSAISG